MSIKFKKFFNDAYKNSREMFVRDQGSNYRGGGLTMQRVGNELIGYFEPDILASIVADYSPLILLGFDEESGTTAVDSSGNGYDVGATTGTPTWQQGALAYDGSTDGESVDTTGCEFTKANFPAFSADGVSFGGWFLAGATKNGYFARCGAGGIYYTSVGRLTWFDGAFRGPDLAIAENWKGFVFIRQNVAGKQDWFLNGLLVSTNTGNANFVSGGSNTLSIGGNGFGTTIDSGHSLFMIDPDYLSDAEMYALARTVGAVPAEGHYYREVVENELGVGGNCIFAPPQWETAGGQAIDVSGNENHGSYVGGPSLGQDPPLGSGLVYSVAQTVSGQRLTVTEALNAATDSATVKIWFKADVGAGRGIWGKSMTGERFGAYTVSGADTIRFDLFDGANLARVTANGFLDNEWHCMVCRLNQTTDEIKMWIDGVSQGTASTATITLASTAAVDWRFGGSYISSAPIENYAGVAVFNAALTDAQCERLSEGIV